MKTRIIYLCLLVIFSTTGCISKNARKGINGNKNIVTRTIQVDDFEEIHLGSNIESAKGINPFNKKNRAICNYIQTDGASSLEISMDENLFDLLDIENKDHKLIIKAKSGKKICPTHLVLNTSSKNLKEAGISGSIDFIADQPLQLTNTSFYISGVGDVKLADEIKDLRRLVIKAFHMTDVEWGEHNDITVDGHMTVSKEMIDQLVAEEEFLEKIDIQIIKPGDHDRWTNTIMDIIPISTKVLGKLGEGITHTITGVYVMLTGVDVNGKQCHEFGSSEGNLKEKLYLNRAGTPGDDDYIISFDVTLAAGMGQERPGPTAAHRACDKFIQSYRDKMKKFKGDKCTERHEYHDIVRPGKKRVLIIKQVAGQGAMYDTHLFAKEPSGVEGGKSIIDMGNMPVILTPNEYRDGMIRSMQ